MKVGIMGATGYTGQELLRILDHHPEAELHYLGSSSSVGKNIAEIYPHLRGDYPVLSEEEVTQVEVLFVALPHGIAAQKAEGILQKGIKIIDLGADFRLRSYEQYEEWYKTKHASPKLLTEAVYGLPEFNRSQIPDKKLVANPGCYPTASLLALTPLLVKGLIRQDTIIIDAKSGVSGAGRGITQGVHYAEVNENFKAYGVGTHRHTPEIEQQLSQAANKPVKISFTPHLVPMTRGILVTAYAQVAEGVGEQALRSCMQEAYSAEAFIHLLPEGTWPQTKYSYSSNHVFLQLHFDSRTGRVVVVSVLDNLVKGAAGQAVQNMNLLFGLPEGMGLEGRGLWP